MALVLSDHRMPGMTGIELLARVRELDPKTVRILVTAYGDAETLTSAINDGSIYRFIAEAVDAGGDAHQRCGAASRSTPSIASASSCCASSRCSTASRSSITQELDARAAARSAALDA